jgi:hypothetical protein
MLLVSDQLGKYRNQSNHSISMSISLHRLLCTTDPFGSNTANPRASDDSTQHYGI